MYRHVIKCPLSGNVTSQSPCMRARLYNNYRCITPLLVPGKVFTHILLACIQPFLTDKIIIVLDRTCRPQHWRLFTCGRSTIDAILCSTVFIRASLYIQLPTDVDIKSYFQLSHCTKLWKALCSKGIPDIFIQLLTVLNKNTGAYVRVDWKLLRIQSLTGINWNNQYRYSL